MSAPNPARYAAIYARVSTEEQADGYSLPSQVEACQKVAAQQGYLVPDPYIFREDWTGKVLDRPLLPQLRELVRTQTVQAVLIYDPDRLARRFALQVILEEEMDQAGVTLIYVNHTRESTPEGRAMGYMRGVFAEVERERIMERTQRGRIYRARAGQVWGGEVKLGYRPVREPHKASWVVDEEEAALVRRIFQMALEGLSEWTIAVQLTRDHIPTRRDRHGGSPKRRGMGVWTPSTVHRILQYEGYIGRWYYGKYRRVSRTQRVRRDRAEWIEVSIPAIIDDATFQAVQRQLATNKTTSRRNRKYDYLLTGGRLRCGRCGRAMTGRTARGKFRYYRCASWANGTEPSGRCYGEVRLDEVERKVWTAVVRVLEEPELIAAEVARQETHAEAQRAEIGQQMALLDAALAKCDREAQRWADAYAAEVINLVELKGYRAEIETRRQGLVTEHGALQAQLTAIGMAAQQVDALTEYCVRVRLGLQTFDQAKKRIALDALNIRVRWTPGQPLAIEGTIPMETIPLMPS